jgi:hypothetical protein
MMKQDYFMWVQLTKEHLHIIRPKDDNKCYPMEEII